mgnify:CR=1 FL=1
MEKQRLSISPRRGLLSGIRVTLRLRIALTVMAISLAGLIMAILIGEIYYQIALRTHTNNLSELVRIQSVQLLSNLRDELSDVGFYLQGEPAFRDALTSKNPTAMQLVLQQQFERQIANQGLVTLLGLSVFDKGVSITAEAFDGANAQQAAYCTDLAKQYKGASGLAAARSTAQLCSGNAAGAFALMVPIGGLNPIGYLQLVVDPIRALALLEDRLGRPVRITRASSTEETLYQSWNWPKVLNYTAVVPSHSLTTVTGDAVLRVTAFYDANDVNSVTTTTRHAVFVVAALLALIMSLVGFRSLQTQVVVPIERLRRQIARIKTNKHCLDEKVVPAGHDDAREIIAGFNDLSGELSRLYDRMQVMTLLDPLTQLPNRLHLQQAIEDMIRLSSSSQFSFAVMIMDIDRFKHLNDSLGHGCGDAILVQVSERLRKCVRATDVLAANHVPNVPSLDLTVARLGGDEFAGLFPLISSADGALAVARNILRTMSAPFVVDAQEYVISLSIGIALFPANGNDPQTLLRRADIAMYAAKGEQKGVMIYNSLLEAETQRQLRVENELRRAIDVQEFELWYQPQIEVASGTAIRVEALLRWRHPERGILSPDDFIPLAEQTGLIVPLTVWVLESAISTCVRWREAGIRIGVAVNISARALTDPSVLAVLPHLLMRYRLDPVDITLELTETTIMTNPQKMIAVLEKLKLMDINLAIDDFGTGYSALTVLKQLPVQELKIDKSFILDMHHNPNDTAIVRATLDIANHLKLRTVAEGVETQPQLLSLAAMGAQIVQGFYIAKPMPEEKFIHWIQRFHWEDYISTRVETESV